MLIIHPYQNNFFHFSYFPSIILYILGIVKAIKKDNLKTLSSRTTISEVYLLMETTIIQ